jgi:2-amino-4-hydroxy-6-hydroxymethyldihydropteridine diphosphokinase
MYKVFLGIGGNIGNKSENFNRVHHVIEQKLGKITQLSSIYETPPWGFSSDDNFWNQVVVIETKFEAEELLWRINEIEDDFGRIREGDGYSSREMDIDILYFEDVFIETKTLTIPHPRIQERRFVLVPLVEIAPDFKHPLLRLTNSELLENCHDHSIIKRIDE